MDAQSALDVAIATKIKSRFANRCDPRIQRLVCTSIFFQHFDKGRVVQRIFGLTRRVFHRRTWRYGRGSLAELTGLRKDSTNGEYHAGNGRLSCCNTAGGDFASKTIGCTKEAMTQSDGTYGASDLHVQEERRITSSIRRCLSAQTVALRCQ